MGRTAFDPAVDNPSWPWPGLDVHVLTSRPLPDKEFETTVTRPFAVDDAPTRDLRLTGTHTYDDGVVQLTYEFK